MAIQKITDVTDIVTDNDDWWMLYVESSKIVIEGIYQCQGIVDSPNTMVIADTREELLAYITDNNLTVSEDIEERGY